MAAEPIRKGGEVVACTKCGGPAITKDCRRGFEPSIQSLSEASSYAWHEVDLIIRDLAVTFDGFPEHMDALELFKQRCQAARR